MTKSKLPVMKKEIFIIDDDPIYRLIVSKMIKNRNSSMGICECDNGEIGLAELKKRDGSDHRIVILLDINMPVVNGWSFLEELEKNKFYDLPHLDIYMVSSSIDESDKVKAKKNSFIKGFYHKPLGSEDFELFIGED